MKREGEGGGIMVECKNTFVLLVLIQVENYIFVCLLNLVFFVV